MDVNALHNCFAATLSPNQAERQQAELLLKQAAQTPGFLGGCLDLITNSSTQPSIAQAAALYFKNRIVRGWARQPGANGVRLEADIDQDERPVIRDRLLELLVRAPPLLRQALFGVLSTVVLCDYPAHWPGLVTTALELMGSSDADLVYVGVLAFTEVARRYRWMENDKRPELDQLLVQVYPILLQLGTHLLQEQLDQAGEMVKLVLKAYKFATYFDLPVELQKPELVVAWGTFHVNVVNAAYPPQVMQQDKEVRLQNPWVKCKKWAFCNLFRLFTRYALLLQLLQRYDYPQYRQLFQDQFVPLLLPVYFSRLEEWGLGQLWLLEELLHYLLGFVEHAVKQKTTWGLVKPHVETLVAHVLYPILCASDERLETFEDDPQEYIGVHYDVFEDLLSGENGALLLLVTLADKRRKTALPQVLQFAHSTLSQLQTDQSGLLEVAKKTEGALRVIGAVLHTLTSAKLPYQLQMEAFVVQFVVPHFQLQHGFLRARSCEMACRFLDVPFSPATLGALFQGIMSCFGEAHLVIRLEAALAIQQYLQVPAFSEALGQVVVPTVEKLLELSNTVDHDAILGVMQLLVEEFAVQLQPFGVELMSKLAAQFMRLAVALNNEANADPDLYDDSVNNGDKQMAALGLLGTMVTVLLLFENSTEVVGRLEEEVAPCVEFVLVNGLDDYFAEIAELVENCTFLSRKVLPAMWRVLGLVAHAFASGAGTLYSAEFVPTLSNYLVYGGEELPRHSSEILTIYGRMMELALVDEYDQLGLGAAAEIALLFIVTVRLATTDAVLQRFLADAVTNLVKQTSELVQPTPVVIQLTNVVVAGLVLMLAETLSFLVQQQAVGPFLRVWFALMPQLQRVYDLKLSLLALMALVLAPQSDLTGVGIDELGVAECGVKFADLMLRLPAAITDLERRRQTFGEDYFDGQGHQDFGGDEWENDFDDDEEGGEGVNSAGTLRAFAQEGLGEFGAGGDGAYPYEDELVDDPLASTPLDNVNIYAVYKTFFGGVQADGAKWGLFTLRLDSDQQDVLVQSAQVGE